MLPRSFGLALVHIGVHSCRRVHFGSRWFTGARIWVAGVLCAFKLGRVVVSGFSLVCGFPRTRIGVTGFIRLLLVSLSAR